MMEMELMCSFLPSLLSSLLTGQITLNPSGKDDNPASVVIIVIYNSNGNVGVLKQFSELLWC
jgi:hypothetical protein